MTSAHPRPYPLARFAVATLLPLAPLAQAQAQTASETALNRRLDEMANELTQLRAQLGALQQQRASVPQAAAPTATAPVAAPVTPMLAMAAPAPAAADAPPQPSEPATVLSSYGEINYNRPRKAPGDTRADLVRFVLGNQHRFDDKTNVVAELEVEHAVASAGDAGEVAIEQANVEHQITPTWGLRAGLFLVPMGLLNENHEPTAFYGVERNFVESRIIPTTWREGGVQLIANFDNGLTLQSGVSTGFDLNK